ncbi:MAG: hypothetical protein AB7E95_02810 [Kiritimatiellales bacterium]
MISEWLERQSFHWTLFCCLSITVCGGMYGAAIGLWRAGLMATYVAIKFPLLIFLTTLCNTTLNWMLALVMGAGFSFRQTLLTQLMSFTIATLIFGSMTPVALFMLYNTPTLASGNHFGHSFFLLLNVVIIAAAGFAANIRLYGFLLLKTGSRVLARRILIAWVVGNLFVGGQLSWNLRPFIGSPTLEIQFLRPDPFNGNFYESVYRSGRRMFHSLISTEDR